MVCENCKLCPCQKKQRNVSDDERARRSFLGTTISNYAKDLRKKDPTISWKEARAQSCAHYKGKIKGTTIVKDK